MAATPLKGSGGYLRVLALAAAVEAALAAPQVASPGKPFVLSFPDLPPGQLSWEVSPLVGLSLPPEGGGLVLAVLEAPLSVPPGTYAVCAQVGKERRCQEVRVAPLVRWEAEVPKEAQSELKINLRNLGNVPLPYVLTPYRSQTVSFPRKEGQLAPGEELRLSLPLRGSGLLLLRLRIGDEERFYIVRAEGQGEAFLYRLRGQVGVAWSPGGPAGSLALGGRLSREVETNFLLGLQMDRMVGSAFVRAGPWEVGATTSPSFRLAYAEGPWRVGVAYPFALQASWRQGGEGWSLSADPKRVRVGYIGPGVAVGVGYDGLPSFRLEGLGYPRLYVEVERGVRLGGMWPGWSAEAKLLEGEGFRLSHQGYWEQISYQVTGQGKRLGEGWAWNLSGGLAWRLGAANLSLSGSLGEREWLALGLRFREEPWDLLLQGRWDASGPSLSGALSWREAPWSLSLSGGVGSRGDLRLALSGAWGFEVPVPEGVTSVLGGFEGRRVEGVVRLGDRPLQGALVRAGGRQAVTDREGRFRLEIPPGEGELRVLPPSGVLALGARVPLPPEGEVLEIRLEALAALQIACGEGGRGARVQGPTPRYVACGEEALLVPGRYRVLPEAQVGYVAPEAVEVSLAPSEGRLLRLEFSPRPLVSVEAATEVEVKLPSDASPGEEVTVSVKAPGEAFLLRLWEDGRVANVLEGKVGGPPLTFQVPWEAKDPLTLEFIGEGWRVEKTLRVKQGEVPLGVRLDPVRAAPGSRVRVEATPLFPATEAWVKAGQRRQAMQREGERRFFAEIVLDEPLLAEAEELLPGILGLDVEVEARQGERTVKRLIRLLVVQGP